MSCQLAAVRKTEGFIQHVVEDTCPGGVCPMKKKSDHCPNSDPGFNKIIGTDRTPEERSDLFVICVLVRTLLYSGVYVYRDKPWMTPLVGALALASIFQLYTPDSPQGKQWWSKKFQLFMAVCVLISALLVKFKGLDSRSMAGLLFVSLLGGILQRSQVKLC
jgi:hypothetical protein